MNIFTNSESASPLRNNELGEFTSFIVRILFVPGKDLTYPLRVPAANTALRNGPGNDWSGLGVLGTSNKKEN